MNKETERWDIHLNDEQYRRILHKIQYTLAQDDFRVVCTDCTITGFKSTDSNCGFCNEEYTEEDTALFPSEYPNRRSMKYRQDNHRCPFDTRKVPHILHPFSWGSGCFFRCYLFEHLRKRDWNLTTMRGMVAHTLRDL